MKSKFNIFKLFILTHVIQYGMAVSCHMSVPPNSSWRFKKYFITNRSLWHFLCNKSYWLWLLPWLVSGRVAWKVCVGYEGKGGMIKGLLIEGVCWKIISPLYVYIPTHWLHSARVQYFKCINNTTISHMPINIEPSQNAFRLLFRSKCRHNWLI